MPGGWQGSPIGAITLAGKERNAKARVVRILVRLGSTARFATLTDCIERDFAGKRVTLRGNLRTDDVKGFAGFWLREDGDSGYVAFDNMHERNVHGTTGWHEYSVTLPVKKSAKRLSFGSLLVGSGEARVSGLQLLVDGKPVWQAPKSQLPRTVLDTDREFDHGSGITIDRLSRIQIENLVTLGRIWGFLKYYDPAVTSGRYQWDYELFRIMPKVLASPNREQADALLSQWVKSLGPVPRCQPCTHKKAEEPFLRPDLEWIDDQQLLGQALSEELRNIRENHGTGAQFYVTLSSEAGNPVFLHELPYAEIRLPDAGFQLLALYRFWNIVDYWYPYRNIVGEDWDDVLTEFVPRLALARTRKDYELALMQLIGAVHDSHASLWSSLDVRPPVGRCQLPVRLRFIERQPVITSSLTQPGSDSPRLERGDVLTRLDGVPVSELISEWTPYYDDSNEAARLRDIAFDMTRGKCGSVEVGIRRGNRLLSLTLKRIEMPPSALASPVWDVLPGPAFQFLSSRVAYLKLSSAQAEEAADYIKRAEGTWGLIIDLRDYPSQFMVFALGSHLVSRPTPFVRFSQGDLAEPGAFVWGKTLSLMPEPPHYSGKVLILVNQLTQSQAEYTAMAFRAAPGAIVVGSTTAGADGNVSPLPLPGGLRTLISGIGVFYPDDRPTQRIGIIPNVVVRPTISAVRAGKDPVLEKAISLIRGPQTPRRRVSKTSGSAKL